MSARRKIKIGRNEHCPCGSGKKYKHCCLKKAQKEKTPTGPYARFEMAFSKYEKEQLIAIIGGLLATPECHEFNLRLEAAQRIACLSARGRNSVTLGRLEQELNTGLQPLRMHEDPIENLFTENIIFHGGNYRVFPGIGEQRAFTLSNLLGGIFQTENDLSVEFIKSIANAVLGLLTLSEEIARRQGIQRNFVSEDTGNPDISLPPEEVVASASTAVIFNDSDLDRLFGSSAGIKDTLQPFCLNFSNPKLKAEDPHENPLYKTPLVSIDNGIIVAMPNELMSALIHYIWSQAQDHRVFNDVIKLYRKQVLDTTIQNLQNMFYKYVNLPLPERPEKLPIEECLFQIDSDKLAYLLLITDSGENYRDMNGMWDARKYISSIEAREKDVVQHLRSLPGHENDEIFILAVMAGMGRAFMLGFGEQPEHSRFLPLTAEEIEILSKIREYDQLTLWKYVESRDTFKKRSGMPRPISSWCLLDVFEAYRNHNDSFYFSDDKSPNMINFEPGTGRNLRIEGAQNTDEHATLIGIEKRFIKVVKAHPKTDIPIYFDIDSIGSSRFNILVEGYDRPIWVTPFITEIEVPRDTRHLYFQFSRVISYWLWQLQGHLHDVISRINDDLLAISFSFEEPEKWISGTETEEPESLEVGYEFLPSHPVVKITIPDGLRTVFNCPDNSAERILVEIMIQALNEYVYSESGVHPINSGTIDEIVDTIAPLGRKRAMQMVSESADFTLINVDLPEVRTLQIHNIELELDGVFDDIDEDIPVGDITEKADQTRILGKMVVAYLTRLRTQLEPLDWRPLLKRLISLQESIFHEKSRKRLSLPAELECYPQRKETLVEETRDMDQIALTSRILIEIVAAEPPGGTKVVSTDELDKILAITYQLVNFATHSDMIHFDLVDSGLSRLESGRIGIDRQPMQNFWDPFLAIKSEEHIDTAARNYINYFRQENEEIEEQSVNTELDDAFLAEFGFKFEEVAEFLNYTAVKGISFSDGFAHMKLAEFKSMAAQDLSWQEAKIDDAIALFSLGPRERWDKAPVGYTARDDIWPWRYNRRLSYIRKPLIIGPDNGNDTELFWGPRNTHEIGPQLLHAIYTGRYRTFENSSAEMKAYVGRVRNEAGDDFEEKVVKWFEENSSFVVHPEVPLKVGKALDPGDDLGDIDVLCVDESTNICYSIECKNINSARNAQEMGNEIEKLMEEDSEKSLTAKHLRRHDWLVQNKDKVAEEYGLDKTAVSIVSVFLTSVELPSPFLKTMPLPFIAYSTLNRLGLDHFMSKLT